MMLSQKKTAKIKDDKEDKNIYLLNNVHYPTALSNNLTTLGYRL
jgi:hypothetical protein